jgi:hypothetical protein
VSHPARALGRPCIVSRCAAQVEAGYAPVFALVNSKHKDMAFENELAKPHKMRSHLRASRGAMSAGSEVGWLVEFRFLDMVAAPIGLGDKEES